jgi:hypothetical protein
MMRFRLWSSRRSVDRDGDEAVDAALAAHFQRTPAGTDQAAERVLARLRHVALPAQRRGIVWRWPSALLTSELAPAWSSISALGCAALIGFGVGSLARAPAAAEAHTVAQVFAGDVDFGNAVFDYDPVHGVTR